jgi:hypothetical protein
MEHDCVFDMCINRVLIRRTANASDQNDSADHLTKEGAPVIIPETEGRRALILLVGLVE